MGKKRTPVSVSFTAERLRTLDDNSARQFEGRIGQILAEARRGHVVVEFPAEGARRPVRLDCVRMEHLEVVSAD